MASAQAIELLFDAPKHSGHWFMDATGSELHKLDRSGRFAICGYRGDLWISPTDSDVLVGHYRKMACAACWALAHPEVKHGQ